jgi:ATP-binding cassette subfamily F protein 3
MLELRDLRLRRGAAVLFDRANLTIFRGDKIGIVGRNGCGKSSLLALLRGDIGADAGDYSVPGKLNFVSVSQELPRTELTVLEYVRSGDSRLMAIEAELAKARAEDDGMKEAHLLGDYELAGGYTAAARAAELADGLGFEPGDIDRQVKTLSGGLQMRANMAHSCRGPTCSCSTSRLTTWISTPCCGSSTGCRVSRAPCCWYPMTASSSTTS